MFVIAGTYILAKIDFLSVCQSVRLSVCTSVRLSACPSVRLPVHLSVCFNSNVFESIQLPAVNLFVPLFVYPCILSFFQSVKVNVGLLTSLPIHSSVDSSTLFWILSVCSLFVCLSILLVSSYVF
jgi:hypothetical protein